MANIHRIGDDRANPSRNRLDEGRRADADQQGPVEPGQMIRLCQQHRVPFYSGSRPVKNPRQQNYCDFLITAFCPTIKWFSFTIIIIIVDIILFIAEVSVGLDRQGELLQVSRGALDTFKANYPQAVYNGEVYRLLTAIGLHVHFLHLVLNVLATFILCSRIEQTYRVWYTMLFYFLSGIAGNIFSDSITKNPERIAAGASTALYGLVGVLLGYVIINWNGLRFLNPIFRCRILMIVVFMLFFSIFFVDSNSSTIDYFGHLGGFIGGLGLSGIPPSIVKTNRELVLRIVAVCIFVLEIVICFAVFYKGRKDIFG